MQEAQTTEEKSVSVVQSKTIEAREEGALMPEAPKAVKKKPFIPPLLGAKNLGMSTLQNAEGKT